MFQARQMSQITSGWNCGRSRVLRQKLLERCARVRPPLLRQEPSAAFEQRTTRSSGRRLQLLDPARERRALDQQVLHDGCWPTLQGHIHPVERQFGVLIAIPRGERALIFIPRPVPLRLPFQHARRCGVTEDGADWYGPILCRGAAIRIGCGPPITHSFLALTDPEGRDPRVIASWKLREVRLVT